MPLFESMEIFSDPNLTRFKLTCSFNILSALIHQGYQWYLISAYKIGDLTKVYPIARGTGPIIATLISIGLLGVLI